MPGTKKGLAYKRVLLKLSGEALLGEKTVRSQAAQ